MAFSVITRQCAFCHQQFEYERTGAGRPPNCCSPSCTAKRKRQQQRDEYDRPPWAGHDQTCAAPGCCGKQQARGYCPKHYQRWLATGNALATTKCQWCGGRIEYRKMFCSAACRKTAKKDRSAAKPERCAYCDRWFISRSAHQQFCSRACQRKASWAARAAHRRSVRVETVSPELVFKRDSYRCHLCGARTLKSKRGTCHDKAPEIDHIIPLSKGGAHSYRNTACACRKCNAMKSNQIIGQLRLFGAVPA